jgi:hypothetical protein
MSTLKKKFVKLLIDERIKKISKLHVKRISKVKLDADCPLNLQIAELHKRKWGKIFSEEVNLKWLQWYSQKSGIDSPDFIPENVFYTIVEPIINDARFAVCYSDKNLYDWIYPKGLFPETIVRNVDGLYYDQEYKALEVKENNNLTKVLLQTDRVFVKPATDTGGGRDVDLFILNDGQFINREGQALTLENLNRTYNHNFVIQKVLQQHPFLSHFNPSSLNTLRVLTYRSPIKNDINILQVVFRIGAKDQYLDNSRAGGYSVGVNSKGVINKFAFRKDGCKFTKVNTVDLSESEFVIPFFEEIQSTAKVIAERNIHHRMLALDMTIDNENNIRCVEVNNKCNEINFHQLNNGPLFGNFTDEVIAYCEMHKENLYKEFTLSTIPYVL